MRIKKMTETMQTPFLAARYALAFCFKHDRFDTIVRLIIAASSTLVLYLSIRATGLIVNAVQKHAGKADMKGLSFAEFAAGDLAMPILFLLCVLLCGAMLGRLSWFFRSRWGQRLRFANEQQFNDHRASLDVARFRSKEYDDLEKRIAELPTSWQTRIWFSEEMLILFTTVVSFFLFGISLLASNPGYALILVLSALPMMIAEFQVVGKFWDLFEVLVPHHKKRKMLEKPYKAKNAFVQALMFQQMPSLKSGIERNADEVVRRYDAIRKESVIKEMVTWMVAIAGLSAVVIHAIWNTVRNGGGAGTLTVLLAASRAFQGNLEVIISLVAEQWNSAKGVILIERDFLGLRPVLKTDDPIVPCFKGPVPLRFEKVSFAYPDTDTLVLKDVSFDILPGSTVAIVGKSGNGKSSLAALLMRHYDPSSGTIFADGIDLKRISPDDWAEHAAALTQEYSILERTIAEEVASSRLGEPIDLEVVSESCRFAHFSEVVDADPKGFESQIGIEFGGRDFSGGERQRLALARVHYRRAPILVLDEPDARLDPDSAQKVMDRVFALEDTTVILITHHVSRAEACDQILVMGKGEIAEQGTHHELMAKNGIYAAMFEADKKRIGQVGKN